ncbi:MAG: adenosylcobinamide-GDP ribazoletransferase, partial [Bacillota bacterium]|nr:adenosylcobinamide-GDP ribazoletransferase [Bacillota bacterium]
MILFKRFILMLQFLTAIPIRVSLEVSSEDFGKGLMFAPVIGLIIGGIIALTRHFLIILFPPLITTALIVVEYILLTGGLHLDGLGDTFDGLFSNRPRERMLEIMKDSRVGTNAVLAICSVILLNFAALSNLGASDIFKALILFPVAGRTATLIGASVSNYARENGLGKSFIDFCGWREMVLGLVFCLAAFFLILRIHGLILAAITILTSFLILKLFTRK